MSVQYLDLNPLNSGALRRLFRPVQRLSASGMAEDAATEKSHGHACLHCVEAPSAQVIIPIIFQVICSTGST